VSDQYDILDLSPLGGNHNSWHLTSGLGVVAGGTHPPPCIIDDLAMDTEKTERARKIREQQLPEDLYEFRKLLICPDFLDVWAEIDDDDTGDIGLPIGEELEWVGKPSIPYDLIDRFDSWQKKFARAPFDDDMFLLLDWDAFHKEGMALAVEIKRALGENVIVTYVKAFEDRGRGEETRFEIT
jgi:hypothetical protein